MLQVRVPSALLPDLIGPLALRGLAASADPVSPPVSVARGRPAAGRWLALVDDDAAAVAALDEGADDAARADAPPALLAARIARLARPAPIVVGPLTIDPLARIATRDGRVLSLLPREYAVLAQLARHADATIGRDALHTAVWGRPATPGTNVIEVHVSRLRAELDRGAAPMLLTERGRGYRLVSRPIARGRRAA